MMIKCWFILSLTFRFLFVYRYKMYIARLAHHISLWVYILFRRSTLEIYMKSTRYTPIIKPSNEVHSYLKLFTLLEAKPPRKRCPRLNTLTKIQWPSHTELYLRSLYIVSGGLYHANWCQLHILYPPSIRQWRRIRHVFDFGAYSRAPSPDILNTAQWI